MAGKNKTDTRQRRKILGQQLQIETLTKRLTRSESLLKSAERVLKEIDDEERLCNITTEEEIALLLAEEREQREKQEAIDLVDSKVNV